MSKIGHFYNVVVQGELISVGAIYLPTRYHQASVASCPEKEYGSVLAAITIY